MQWNVRLSGVGEVISQYATQMNISHVYSGNYCICTGTQGSATVAMIQVLGYSPHNWRWGYLVYHPVYIFLAIGFGSITLSWMNDSGFGSFKNSVDSLKGNTKTWSVLLTVISEQDYC